jgi:hypothetical protein
VPPPKEHLTTIGGLSILAAFLCFVAAVIFGCMTTVRLNTGNSAADAPNVAGAGAACGFGVATGLCLVAAAIAESGARRRESRPTPPSAGESPGGGAV